MIGYTKTMHLIQDVLFAKQAYLLQQEQPVFLGSIESTVRPFHEQASPKTYFSFG
jgi:hypothetical protein